MKSSVESPKGGQLVSWCGFVFGSVMSIAANVLHAWLPVADMPPGWVRLPGDTVTKGWAPSIATQIGAAAWPVALLISVEVLSRVQWPDKWTWSLARYGGAGTVAVGSALISYGHLRDVLAQWGYGEPGSSVGPLVLDGLMVVSGFALLAMGHPLTAKPVGDSATPKDQAATPPVDTVAVPAGAPQATVGDLVTRNREPEREIPELDREPDREVIPEENREPERGADQEPEREESREDGLAVKRATRWAVAEVKAGRRRPGWERIRKQFPELTEHFAREAARRGAEQASPVPVRAGRRE